jgi:hypothetical protein
MAFSWLRDALRRYGTGKVLVVALLVQLVPIAVAVLLVWLSSFTVSDKIAASGDVFVIAALVYAVLGTAIAVLAWLTATEKPVLRLEGWRASETRGLVLANWKWDPVIQNEGHVAARFVAVRVTFEGCVFKRPAPPSAWRLNPPGSDDVYQAEWSGGADIVVHAGFDFPVPALWGQIQMSEGTQPKTMVIEVVADNFTKTTHRWAVLPPAGSPGQY